MLCNRVSSVVGRHVWHQQPSVSRLASVVCRCTSLALAARSYSSDSVNHDVSAKLALFFDKPANYGVEELPVTERPGRPWSLQELRLKSNADLHELWFVLLIERNMLLTMEHAHNENYRRLPNPERIDKVEESMSNVEAVVAERNAAYLQLETGHDGSRPERTQTSIAGFREKELLAEHLMPPQLNPNKPVKYEQPYLTDDQHMFQKLWAERQSFKRQRRRDDYLRRTEKARLWYSTEEQVAPYRDYYENEDAESSQNEDERKIDKL